MAWITIRIYSSLLFYLKDLRSLLAFDVSQELDVIQMAVDSAFLQATIEEEI